VQNTWYNADMEHASNNPYALSRMKMQEKYAPYISGSDTGLLVAVCCRALGDPARNALEKSAEALGYGAKAITYVQAGADSRPLESTQLFELVEGLDPLFILATDDDSRELCAQTYRTPFAAFARCRLMGREARGFDNMDSLMKSAEGKQRVWAALKTLPARPDPH